MQRALIHLLTTLAFVASLFAVPLAPVKKGSAGLDAARLAMSMLVAKPSPRKAERTRDAGPAMTPCVSAAPSIAVADRVAPPTPKTWIPSAPDQSELMVFLI